MQNNQTQNTMNTQNATNTQNTTVQGKMFTDKEIIDDALHSEKQMISSYGTFLAEATCQNLRSELTKIINDKQQLQYQIYDTMVQKGWYPSKKAKLNEVQSAAQKFGAMKQQLM